MGPWVTFDLDGTLADSPFERVIMPWIVQALERAGIDQARERLTAEQQRRFASGDRVAGFHWDGIAAALLAPVGGRLDQDIVQAMQREPLADLIRSLVLYEDVQPSLAALRQRGYRLAVVTNGHARYQQALFDLMGVAKEFDLMIGPDVVGCAKPDPAIFQSPALAGQIRMHVGDLLTQDVRAAREARISAVLVVRTGDSVDQRDGAPVSQEADEFFAQATHALAALAPTARPAAALQSGWLMEALRRECAFLRRAIPVASLTPHDVHVPDAIVFSFEELLTLLA